MKTKEETQAAYDILAHAVDGLPKDSDARHTYTPMLITLGWMLGFDVGEQLQKELDWMREEFIKHGYRPVTPETNKPSSN